MKKSIPILIAALFSFATSYGQSALKKAEVTPVASKSVSPQFGDEPSKTKTADVALATGDETDGRKMTFQGSLFQNGEPFNGTATLKFTIQIDSSAWTETQPSVSVINGLYSVVLGQFSPLPKDLFYGVNERTVKVEVDDTVLGNVTLYAPFSVKPEIQLPLDMPGENGYRSVMLASEGETGNDGIFRLSNEYGGSRVTMFANKYNRSTDDQGTVTEEYTGAGGAWFGGANGSMGAFISSDGPVNSNGYLELGDSSGTPRVRAFINQFESGFARGEVNLTNNTDGRYSILRPDQLYFIDENTQYPSGWYGTNNGGGFSQLVGSTEEGEFTGAILTGFWNENRPSLWLEDGLGNMGAFLTLQDSAGMLQLNGKGWNPNIQMGPKDWENSNLPYLVMRGETQTSFTNDNGTPEDSTDDFEEMGYPDLVWMEAQKWDDGTEVGNLVLRGTDGSEFEINSHGLGDMDELKVGRIEMADTLERTGALLSRRLGGGGLLYFPSVSNEFTYNWIQNSVNEDGSAAGSAQVADIAADGSYVSGTGMTGGGFYIDSWANEQFYTNVVMGLSQGDNKLPFLHLRGDQFQDWVDDNETPEDTTDDTSGSYLPDLVSMEVQKWEDGTQVGNLILRGTDGSEFGFDSHGFTGNSNLNLNQSDYLISNDEGAVKVELNYYETNDAGSLILNGNNDDTNVIMGSMNYGNEGALYMYDSTRAQHVRLESRNEGGRLQLSKYNTETQAFESAIIAGNGDQRSYFSMYGQNVDATNAAYMVDLYITGNDPNGTAFTGNYKRSGIDFLDNEGTRLAALGSARDESGSDPTGKSGLMMLWGTDDVPNVEVTGKRWENAQLPILQLFGSTSDGNGWYHRNAAMEVNTDGTFEWGSLSLEKTDIANNTSENTINLDGNTGDINASGTVYSGGVALTSDARFKTNIETLEGTLDHVMKMRGVSYNWKDENKDQRNQIGVIAQEVEEIYPEFVHTRNDGYKAVNYSQMTAVLIEAVKELNAKIADLESENSDLKAQLDASAQLEIRLDQIEKLLGVKAGEASNANNK
ncbi:MAG: tail fiber domain-containing protein [Cyclobacteriaceae bacterium]